MYQDSLYKNLRSNGFMVDDAGHTQRLWDDKWSKNIKKTTLMFVQQSFMLELKDRVHSWPSTRMRWLHYARLPFDNCFMEIERDTTGGVKEALHFTCLDDDIWLVEVFVSMLDRKTKERLTALAPWGWLVKAGDGWLTDAQCQKLLRRHFNVADINLFGRTVMDADTMSKVVYELAGLPNVEDDFIKYFAEPVLMDKGEAKAAAEYYRRSVMFDHPRKPPRKYFERAQKEFPDMLNEYSTMVKEIPSLFQQRHIEIAEVSGSGSRWDVPDGEVEYRTVTVDRTLTLRDHVHDDYIPGEPRELKQHDVMGHWRRCGYKNCSKALEDEDHSRHWVTPHKRGDEKYGKIVKDYKVEW